MYYTIRHITRFRYSKPISESIMEVRIQPRSEDSQHCLDFRLLTTPRVDSPIDEALRLRKGVCQDYAHITITLARQLGIPCRYVSGYLYQPVRSQDRSSGEATHAWVEAYLPDLGWVGFDPTNNTTTDERHIRVAIGRDYADVPPTRGVYRGKAESELAVTVRIAPSQMAITGGLPMEPPTWAAATPQVDERDQDQSQLHLMPQQQQQLNPFYMFV